MIKKLPLILSPPIAYMEAHVIHAASLPTLLTRLATPSPVKEALCPHQMLHVALSSSSPRTVGPGDIFTFLSPCPPLAPERRL